MESFLKLVLDKEILHLPETVLESGNDNLELSFIKFLQKIIFKECFMVEFEEILQAACSSQHFSVKNDIIKKIIVALNSVLLSDIDSKCKIDIFRCVFQTFILSCNKNERLPALQFFIVLAHILGLDNISNEGVADAGCIVNDENFKDAFGVEISTPSEVSYSVLRELLVCFSKWSLITHASDKSVYHKWLQKLIRKLANMQPFQSSFLEIFTVCIDIDFKFVEKNIEHIMRGVLSQKPPLDGEFNKLYEGFLVSALKMSAKIQRTVKFVRNFLVGIKTTSTILSEEVILPLNFVAEFSETVAFLSTQQTLLLLDHFMLDLAESCSVAAENSSGLLMLSVVSKLLVATLRKLKIYAPNISSKTLQMLTNKLFSLIEVLQKFSKDVLNESFIIRNEKSIKAHLELCLYCSEVKALIDCYKDSVMAPSEMENSTTEKDQLCCLKLKQWKNLVKIVLKANLEVCYPICFQLALHKLRTLQLQRTTEVEKSVVKLILSRFELELNKFNIFQQVSPEDITIIISFLTPDQARTTSAKIFKHILNAEQVEWKSWLCDSYIQDNLIIVVNLFSESLKEIGSVLGSTKFHSEFAWLLDDYFNSDNRIDKENLKHLPVKVNSLLKRWKKVNKTLGSKFEEVKQVIRTFEVFKLLPVNHLNEDSRQLGLSFAVAVAVILSHEESAICLPFESLCCFLASDTDASTCFDVGLFLKWMCELALESKEASDLKIKVIEGMVRNCPKMKFGLSQMGEMIEIAETLRQESPLKMLETRVVLYQELGKCWQRGKKRQANNDMIGNFRTKLARVIGDEAKNLENSEIKLENCKIFFRVFSIELHKAMKSNEEEISVLMREKFPYYFEFAIKSLNETYDEPSASFLTFVLSSTPQLKKFLPDNTILKIWKSLRQYEKGNWRLFCSYSDDDEFNVIVSDLLQLSEKFFTSEPDRHLSNYFDIWSSFFEVSSESKRHICQLRLQDLFRFTHDCDLLLKDLPIEKRIHLMRFYSYCASSEKVILTSHMLDTIIHIMGEFLDDSSPVEDFRSLFLVEVDTASAFLQRQFLWTKYKVHLSFVLFQRMVGSLTKRCDVTRQVCNDDIIMLSTCAFELEKWVKLMVNRKRDFARTVAYFITTVISAIASITILPAIKFHLINCINHFLNMSDTHSVAYLMRVLKPGYQQVFSSIYYQFKKYHKYTGKI